MSLPLPLEGVPPGLEYLTMVDEVMIYQMYYVFEESKPFERLCCGPNRNFVMHILDSFGREVLRIRRPFRCCGGGCFGLCVSLPCCGSICTVESPPGHTIGTIEQKIACCASSFAVKNHENEIILRIDGPRCFLLYGCQDKEFPIETAAGDRVGHITKKQDGYGKGTFEEGDAFRLTFPINLDVRAKAILLGAAFLIDFLELEELGMKT
ncbi:Scramblase [Oesophagostomum dentatum]|uniref:Phospholipid scramblase n=1 Tax=Oesophagostomum dentatum TaxID=61180 RepID=A0A0B1T834_OESDE|nr:Scramblase [Oesophagostomum dentatum]